METSAEYKYRLSFHKSVDEAAGMTLYRGLREARYIRVWDFNGRIQPSYGFAKTGTENDPGGVSLKLSIFSSICLLIVCIDSGEVMGCFTRSFGFNVRMGHKDAP